MGRRQGGLGTAESEIETKLASGIGFWGEGI